MNVQRATSSILSCALAIAVSSPLSAQGPAAQLQDSSHAWVFRFDDKINGQLKENVKKGVLNLTVKNRQITGIPAGGDNFQNATWSGQVFPGKSMVVQLRENGPDSYVAVYSGMLVNPGHIVGTYADTRGVSGDFSLTLKK